MATDRESLTEQVITHVGAGVEANAVDGDEHQRRSYPDSGGGWQAGGYEYIRSLNLKDRAEPLADEAVALLSAPQCPSGQFTIILDPSQLYLQLHESCGHPTGVGTGSGTAGVGKRNQLPDHGQSFAEGLPLRTDPIDIAADANGPRRLGQTLSAGTTRAWPHWRRRLSRTLPSPAS